jgi:uncharacterized protein YbjT (DUF2867 family)
MHKRNVAVAGGTGSVGRTFAETLVNDGKHNVFVLGRKVPAESAQLPGVTYLQANYGDVEATVKTLEENNIDTIVSAIAIESEETSKGQLGLIEAAEKAEGVKRFVPSEWGVLGSEEYVSPSTIMF